MPSLTTQDGKLVLRDGQVGLESECCCEGGGGICVCLNGDFCEDGITEEQCLARLYATCYFEIFEAQLGFTPQGQEDCPPGWLFDGLNGCTRIVCAMDCAECDALNPYGNGNVGCSDDNQIGVWIPNTTCANEFP